MTKYEFSFFILFSVSGIILIYLVLIYKFWVNFKSRNRKQQYLNILYFINTVTFYFAFKNFIELALVVRPFFYKTKYLSLIMHRKLAFTYFEEYIISSLPILFALLLFNWIYLILLKLDYIRI
jgi:hypothetical protein